MTPAEMREAAVEALKAARDYAGLVEEDALRDLAAAIRALPLPETITPREKLRRVREGASCWPQRVLRTTGTNIAITKWAPRWSDLRGWVELGDRTVYQSDEHGDWRTWVLDTLRAEGWDVAEE